jgi:uncharacterized protein (TIGR02117 family)
MRKIRLYSVLRRALASLAILVPGYGAAGMIGGAIPANIGWTPPKHGVRIQVDDNGIHTGLIVPLIAEGVDWRDVFKPGDLRDPRYAGYDHVEIGWGERTFYVETPTWADVRPGTVVAGAIGSSRTLVHVDWLPEPSPSGDTRTIVLRPEEYRRLAGFIRATLAPKGKHQPGYGAGDAFYEARGRYSALQTCNAWTGNALRQAGVRIGIWTPFPVTVMGWY